MRRLIKYNTLFVCVLLVFSASFSLAEQTLTGAGSKEDPYLINSADDLVRFAESVNEGNEYRGMHVLQTADIDLDGVSWPTIGKYEADCAFAGLYDGNGHVIKNLVVSTESNNALFGKLAGTVMNLGIESGNIVGGCAGSITTHAKGNGAAVIVNCYNKASLQGVRAGGIADNFNGRINNCWTACELTAQNKDHIGGIVSYFAISTYNCYSIEEPGRSVVLPDGCKTIDIHDVDYKALAEKLNSGLYASARASSVDYRDLFFWEADDNASGLKFSKEHARFSWKYLAGYLSANYIDYIPFIIVFILFLYSLKAAGSKDNIIIISLIWVFGIAAAFVLFSPKEALNHTHYVSIEILIGAALIMANLGSRILRTVRQLTKGRFTAYVLLALLLMLMLSVKELLHRNAFVNPLLQIVYIIVLTCAGMICIISLITFLENPQKEHVLRNRRMYSIIYIIEGLLFLLSTFPFRPNLDSLSVYYSIMTGNWRDWHTIGYQIYVALCMRLGGLLGQYHPFMACIVQTVIWFVVFFRICHILNKCFGDYAEYCWRIANIVFFIPLMYLSVMYKDVIFSMCVLAFCAEVFFFIHRKKIQISNVIYLAISAAGAALFRHGAIFAVCLTLVGLVALYLHIEIRKGLSRCHRSVAALLCLAFVLCTHFGIHAIGRQVLHMEENPPYIKFTVPIYVCSNLSSTRPDLFKEEDVALLEEYLPFEEWQKGYESDPYWGDTLTRSWGTVGNGVNNLDNRYGFEIVKLNAKLLLRSPLSYLNAITRVTSVVWQIARPMDGYEWATRGYTSRQEQFDRDPILVNLSFGIQQIFSDIEQFLFAFPLTSFIFYRGGIWVFLVIIESAVLIMKKRGRYLFTLTTPLILFFMLMISCPSQDSRFVLPFMETGIFAFGIAKGLSSRREVERQL